MTFPLTFQAHWCFCEEGEMKSLNSGPNLLFFLPTFHQSQQSLSQHSSHLSTHMDESLHAHTHVNTNAHTPTRITLICYRASEVLSTHPRAPTQTPFYLLVLKYFQLQAQLTKKSKCACQGPAYKA